MSKKQLWCFHLIFDPRNDMTQNKTELIKELCELCMWRIIFYTSINNYGVQRWLRALGLGAEV